MSKPSLKEKTFNDITIKWREVKRNHVDINANIPFLYSDIFGMLDEVDKSLYENTIIISIIDIDADGIIDGELLKKSMNEFDEFLKSCYEDGTSIIIVMDLIPSFDFMKEEKRTDFIKIGISDYAIDINQTIRDLSTGELIRPIASKYGPIVLLHDNDDCMRYFSVPYLMMLAFKPSLVINTDAEWDQEMRRLCDLLESAGFELINNYCGFEYSEPYIWPNSEGEILCKRVLSKLSESSCHIQGKDSYK